MSTSGRSNPATDEEPGQLRLERVSSRRNGAWMIASAIMSVIVLVAAIWLQPWAPIPVPPTLPPTTLVAVASPTPDVTAKPTTDPVLGAIERRQCQSPTGWRMVSAETTGTRETRTMYAAHPRHATGPTDTAFGFSFLYANSLRAVGVCVPRASDEAITAELGRVVLWRIGADGVPVSIRRAPVMDGPLYLAGEAYWSPPPAVGATWPPGRYVFELQSADGGPSRWMGLDFIQVVGSTASGADRP